MSHKFGQGVATCRRVHAVS